MIYRERFFSLFHLVRQVHEHPSLKNNIRNHIHQVEKMTFRYAVIHIIDHELNKCRLRLRIRYTISRLRVDTSFCSLAFPAYQSFSLIAYILSLFIHQSFSDEIDRLVQFSMTSAESFFQNNFGYSSSNHRVSVMKFCNVTSSPEEGSY